jgi:hypothetical protein
MFFKRQNSPGIRFVPEAPTDQPRHFLVRGSNGIAKARVPRSVGEGLVASGDGQWAEIVEERNGRPVSGTVCMTAQYTARIDFAKDEFFDIFLLEGDTLHI